MTSPIRVFISSTIYDLRDLRSALRFWLEERGVEVRMSEFNDFERLPDQGTFASCRHALEHSDYYILIVGGRSGCDFEPGVSVTHQEYRWAVKLADQGRLRIVLCIRREVQAVLSDRQALIASGHDPDTVWTTQSRAIPKLEDIRRLGEFVQAIEQTEATRGASMAPTGTVWLYPFDDFRQLVQTLVVSLRLDRSVRARAILAAVRWELAENIIGLVPKSGGAPMAQHWAIRVVQASYPLSDPDPLRHIVLDWQSNFRVAWFWRTALGRERLCTVALHDAVLSGEFLQFDLAQERLISGAILEAMQQLLTIIDDYCSIRDTLRSRESMAHMLLEQARMHEPGEVQECDLALVYGLANLTDNMLSVSLALLRHIINPSVLFMAPTLVPMTPYPDQAERIAAERASHDEVESWAQEPSLLHAALATSPGVQYMVADDLKAICQEHREEIERRNHELGLESASAFIQQQLRHRAGHRDEETGS